MGKVENKIKKWFWNLHFLSDEKKAEIWFKFRAAIGRGNLNKYLEDEGTLEEYRKQVLSIPTEHDQEFYCELNNTPFVRRLNDPKLIAYYLPQFHPNPENDVWWGRGVTEWNNVGRAVPQYIGHYQPRLPGELGYYDLRLKDVLQRQCELAEKYGIYGFAWYFFSFDGKSLLRKPLDMFLDNPGIGFPFCLCWANESWTRKFFGSSKEVIMEQKQTVESYKSFIHDAKKYLLDKRYIEIDEKKLLLVYKLLDIPGKREVVEYWRKYCRDNGIGELYIVGNYISDNDNEYQDRGLDALGEFQLGSVASHCTIINDKKTFVSDEFTGKVYDYKEIVNSELYKINYGVNKLYNAVRPMWDNTPRRNNHDSQIFDGSTPALYQKWLEEDIRYLQRRIDVDDALIFINAWNEWGEGAYLEPDKRYGYAYLQATRNAIERTRSDDRSHSEV